MQQLVALALLLGQRVARALDIGTRAPVAAFEKRDPRPDVDRLFVVTAEILIETRQQEFLDARGTIGLAQRTVLSTLAQAEIGRISATILSVTDRPA